MKIARYAFLLLVTPMALAQDRQYLRKDMDISELNISTFVGEGQECYYQDSDFIHHNCGSGLECTLNRDAQDTDFSGTCEKASKYDELMSDLKADYESKLAVCTNEHKALDLTLSKIDAVLRLESSTDDELEALCKNKDAPVPGYRDLASIQRFDYVKHCAHADQMLCEFELATAVKEGKVLFRTEDRSNDDKVIYKLGSQDKIDEMLTNGFEMELDCSPMYDVYEAKDIPFDLDLLSQTCGKAGYSYYDLY